MFKGEKYLSAILILLFQSLFICVNGKHFVLVHGAFHGAWCWYKVANHLKSAGHNVTTLDMAASGVNPKPLQEVHSVGEYHEPLMAFMASLPQNEKVILVGHSFGGLSVSIAMEKYPHKISVAVFVTATVVSPNLSYTTFLQETRRRFGSVVIDNLFTLDVNKAPILSSHGVEFFSSKLYQLSSAQDLTLALSLVRPIPTIMSNIKSLKNQTAVTKYNNGRVSKVYIISEKDNSVPVDFQRWIIQRTGPFADVKVIKDSDHMVMISKPKQLSSELSKIAHRY